MTIDESHIFVERLGRRYRLSYGDDYRIVVSLDDRVATATLDRGWVDGPCGRTTASDYENTLRLFGVTEEECERLRQWLPTVLNRYKFHYQYLRLSEAREGMRDQEGQL